jgi:hypothetical protein
VLHIAVCVRACVRAGVAMCVGASVHICVYVSARVLCGCGCTDAGVCLRSSSLTYPVCHAQAPYCLRPLAPYFSALSHKRHDFRKKKKVTEYKTRVLISSTTFV